jgi:hypothetical protein
MLGATCAIRLDRGGYVLAGNYEVARHSERSVPRFWFCAKRRDTQSKNLSSM